MSPTILVGPYDQLPDPSKQLVGIDSDETFIYLNTSDIGPDCLCSTGGEEWSVIEAKRIDEADVFDSYLCDGCGEWKARPAAEEQSEHGGAVVLLVCEDCRDRDRVRKP